MNLLKNILRSLIKSLAKLFFFLDKWSKPIPTYRPVSGKVLGSEELVNMVDASLDMWLTTGRFNRDFEKALRDFLGLKYALTVNSGSSANLLALTALCSPKLGERALKRGDEVVCVAAGFPTTVNPIIQNSLRPVFLDIELGSYNIDVTQLERALSPNTKAIFIAHTLGNVFDLNVIRAFCDQHKLWLIEDNCDALGSRYDGKFTGTFGDICTLSFYPAHHITTGEGGAVLIRDPELYKILLSIRDWGRDCWCPSGKDNTCGKRFSYELGKLNAGYDHKYIYSHIGYNLKMTDWQAACGLAQMKQVESFIQRRKYNFKYLYERLKDYSEYLILPEHSKLAEPSWFGFPLSVREDKGIKKVDLVNYLEENGIGTRQLFAGNILRQPAYLDYDFEFRVLDSDLLRSSQIDDFVYELLPNTDYSMRNTFWIGVWPGLVEEDLDYFITVFKSYFAKFAPH
jgi:CDP-6-deoxy-D-xylo-4-hexulose-3-dehydrase